MKKQRVDKRRVLLFLPLVIFLVSAAIFYAMGWGNTDKTSLDVPAKGINPNLPDAQFKTEPPTDKMDIYKLTENDSSTSNGIEAVVGRLGFVPSEDPQTKQINDRLAAINREINNPIVPSKSYEEVNKRAVSSSSDGLLSKDVAKLESLMKNMQSSSGDDPEMAQLNSLMDKIMAIQNPELVRQQSHKSNPAGADSLFKAIPAIIATNQKAIQGSVIELRLLDSILLNGQMIPKGHSVFGLAEFSNQRLNLQIKNIRLGTSVIPVNLTVFDKRDAMLGINAPEALLTDAINGGSSDAISSIGLMGIDQSLTTQIAGTGLDAAKSLFSKRIKRVKQKLKAGYPLLLKDNTKRLK
ncbi:conjugative transposon protein TraM [Pedobacter gandavensis]|uniref:conjugative transposon protein TraM n=1 Tax=Pedobacter gandavensis TaxID=2679963 RepID=UPI00293154CF|nr:conjugative transposon protein TraM [Pedobacter gandavensis]